MTTLDIAQNLGLTPRRIAATHDGEWASACPMCGGEDRFRVWPERGPTEKGGAWWCRVCNKGGDAISLLIAAKGMSFKEACAYLGKALPTRRRGETPRATKRAVVAFNPRKMTSPAELWQEKAAAFSAASHEALFKNKDQLAWLAARGITEETARRFMLGWNPKDLRPAKDAWGLEKDGKDLWLPAGLVIPHAAHNHNKERSHILRIRIRRPEGEPRYCIVSGSAVAPMRIILKSISEKQKGVWGIVESELDAMLIAQDAGDLIAVAALGSAALKPDAELYEELKDSGCILVALDSDEAGGKAWHWWHERFPQADRWPVPSGKDPGDYRRAGGDIRAWILAGLPPGLRPALAHPPPIVASEGQPPISPEAKKTKTEETVIPYYTEEYYCSKCGKSIIVCLPQGRRYNGTCAACLSSNMKKR